MPAFSLRKLSFFFLVSLCLATTTWAHEHHDDEAGDYEQNFVTDEVRSL